MNIEIEEEGNVYFKFVEGIGHNSMIKKDQHIASYSFDRPSY
jgi:hypothetical protein